MELTEHYERVYSLENAVWNMQFSTDELEMHLSESPAGVFSLTMHHCPSKGLLLEKKHIKPYRDYCEHCDALYRTVLEPLGYK